MYFRNRYEAGRILAEHLASYRGRSDVLVLALPRGGVPVAYEVAKALHAPLDVYLVRKLGLPGHEELAMGAVANGNVEVLNEQVVEGLAIPDHIIERVAQSERRKLHEQRELYRDALPAPVIRDQVVILVDDGLATGSTMRAAVEALRRQEPQRLIVAVPVGAADTCRDLGDLADEVVCVVAPEQFIAVGAWYDDFSPTSDSEVQRLLHESSAGAAHAV